MESRKHRFLLLAVALLSGCARQQSDHAEKTRAMILHITKRTEWEAAVSAGEYSAASLHDQGFIHCICREIFSTQVADDFIPTSIFIYKVPNRISACVF